MCFLFVTFAIGIKYFPWVAFRYIDSILSFVMVTFAAWHTPIMVSWARSWSCLDSMEVERQSMKLARYSGDVQVHFAFLFPLGHSKVRVAMPAMHPR